MKTVVAQTFVTYGGRSFGPGMQVQMSPEDADKFVKSKEAIYLKEPEAPKPSETMKASTP